MYIYVYIGLEAQFENMKKFEEGQTQLEESMLVSEEVSLRVHEGGPRMNPSSIEQSRSPKGWLAIQGNIPRDSIDYITLFYFQLTRTKYTYDGSKLHLKKKFP